MEQKIIEILLVEDSPGDVRLTQEILKDLKIINNLNVATNGEEAMNYLHKRGLFKSSVTPDLIFLDLNLPKKNGKEVLIEIKNDDFLKKIPVVILSTSDDEQDILGSYSNDADHYITKPINLNQLVIIIKSLTKFWFSVDELPMNKIA